MTPGIHLHVTLTSVVLQGDEAFSCEVCKQRTEATKHMRIHRLPLVLMLHIKRFKFAGQTREKLTSNVTYPLKVGQAGRMSCQPCSCLLSGVCQLHMLSSLSMSLFFTVTRPGCCNFFATARTGDREEKALTADVCCLTCCSLRG